MALGIGCQAWAACSARFFLWSFREQDFRVPQVARAKQTPALHGQFLRYSLDLILENHRNATCPFCGKTITAASCRNHGCVIGRPSVHTESTSVLLSACMWVGLDTDALQAKSHFRIWQHLPDHGLIVSLPMYDDWLFKWHIVTDLQLGMFTRDIQYNCAAGSTVFVHMGWSAFALCPFLPYTE